MNTLFTGIPIGTSFPGNPFNPGGPDGFAGPYV